MGAAFAFPGTAGLEAEFPQYVPRIRGVWINERFPSAALLAAAATAYALETRSGRHREPRARSVTVDLDG